MNSKNVAISWLITLVIGSLPAAVFIRFSWQSYLLVFLGAAICSSPYLVLFLVSVRKLKGFIQIQLVHFILALLTSVVVAAAENDFSFIPPVYFVCGVAVQAYVYFKNPFSTVEQEENILDS